MEKQKPDVPLLRPGEKIIGIAYLTRDDEIVFTPHADTAEVVLVEAPPGSSGPWAVRVRPPERARAGVAD
jgi:hypothetical protein